MRNEEESLSSPPLQTLQNLELESGGFNMFLGFKEIEDQINTQGLSPSSRRQDYKNHSSVTSISSRYAQTSMPEQPDIVAHDQVRRLPTV